MKILVGGYTKKTAKGIYTLSLDEEHLTTPQLLVNVDNPTYFQVDENNFLYTISKTGDEGGITSFDLNSSSPKQIATFHQPGTPPAYLGLDQKRHYLYVANYHEAKLQVFSYDHGQIQLLSETFHHGSSIKPEQTSAHPHYFDQTPDGKLISADLGTDSLDLYAIDQSGQLTMLSSYQLEAGSGTRHLVFHPNGYFLYVVGELGSTVTALKYDSNQNQFTTLATYSTVPQSFTDDNGAAAIRLSADGQFLYISNRGHDSLVVFKVNPTDGKLELVQRISTFGNFPRDFNWDQTQTYLVVANQTSNNLTLYRRNQDTGALTLLQKDVALPEATRVLFVSK